MREVHFVAVGDEHEEREQVQTAVEADFLSVGITPDSWRLACERPDPHAGRLEIE